MMKKIIFLVLTVLLSLGLIACQDNPHSKDTTPTAPMIVGTKDHTFVIGSDAPDYLYGVAAYDYLNQDISNDLSYDATNVDLETPGMYEVHISVRDSLGRQTVVTVYVTVNVHPDDQEPLPPTIVGHKDMIYTIGDETPDFLKGIQAFDYQNQNITSSVTVDDSLVNYDEVGVYEVTYEVIDQFDQKTSVTVFLTVRQATSEPYFVGVEPIIYYIGDDIPDLLEGIQAFDAFGVDITDRIIVNDMIIDYETPNNYFIILTVEDDYGNQVSLYFILSVLEKDVTAPIIFGVEDIEYMIGTQKPNYLAGVTAVDDVDGNIFAIIGVVSKALKKEGLNSYAQEFREKALSADSYDTVLALTANYVNWE